MKKIPLIILTLLLFKAGFSQSIPTDSLYLGQVPPGNTPKIFKLPVDSGLLASDKISITKDGKNIYYREVNPTFPGKVEKIKYLTYVNNRWTGPFNLFESFGPFALSITEDTIFLGGSWIFTPNPSVSREANLKNYAFQYCKEYFSVRNSDGWDTPKLFSPPLNFAYYLQETNKGNYYFAHFNSKLNKGGLGYREYSKLTIVGKDTTVQSFGAPLSSDGCDGDFSITQDESFMILDGNGKSISFHKSDSTWTNPKSLGQKINFGLASWGPYISPDKKYLFYTTGTKTDYSDTYVYWVRIDGIADSLKKTNYVPYLKTPVLDQSCVVDHFFIFKISDNTFVDDDGNNTLDYVATLENGEALPSWLSFSSKTKTFSGKPESTGKISIKLIAKDIAKDFVSCNFDIEIKNK